MVSKNVAKILIPIFSHSLAIRKRQDWRAIFSKAFIGAIVFTRYNNMSYRIDDIAWNMSPLSTFELHGEQVT